MKTPRKRAPTNVAPAEETTAPAEQAAPAADSPAKPKLKRQRLTGLFRRENKFGTYWTGRLEDGRQVVVHDPFERKENGPDLVLSLLVPDEEAPQGE
jgi:hypothetical protein